MSALNNAWNAAGLGQAVAKYPSDMDSWTSPYQQQAMLGQMRARPAPRLSDMPEQLLQELSADPRAQTFWEGMDAEGQWRLIERHEKQLAQAREQEKINAYDPNNDDAYSVSLSTAVDLWRAKHGDTWVRSYDTYLDTDFYSLLQNRLSDNNCFERMSKYDRAWLRLKENI